MSNAMSAIWPLADICFCTANVRFWGKSGHHSRKSGHKEMPTNQLALARQLRSTTLLELSAQDPREAEEHDQHHQAKPEEASLMSFSETWPKA